MTLNIRDFRESDASALAVLYFDSVHHGTRACYSKEQRDAWAPSVPDAQEFGARLARMIVFVAEDESRIVGFMALDEAGHIDLAYVRPDRIGSGVGSRIYRRVEDTSRERAHWRLSSDASELARPFFEKHGWTVISTQQVERNGVVLTNHRMEKQLT